MPGGGARELSGSTIIGTEDVAGEAARPRDPQRQWRVHADAAWVEGEARIAILDLRDLRMAEPLLCPEPVASLWRALAQGPKGEDALFDLAAAEVGDDDAAGLLEAFVDALAGRGLIEEDA